MRFAWDPAKSARNLAKRYFDFAFASLMFGGPTLERIDSRRDYGEERRIAWMAQEHGIRFIPHGWNTAVGLAADLQLASAFPGTDLVEYLTGSPFIDEITVGGWKLDNDGMLAIPSKPGLGLELDPDAVKKYTGG